MAKNAEWHDEYWLLLLQVFLRKPVGMKPLYSRPMVDLSLELHISPQALQTRMRQLETLSTPRMEHIWQTYRQQPGKLARAASLLRQMKGFGAASEFYDGVELQETFERDFRPLAEDSRFTPAQLIMVLNLYFQLTPLTMVAETPEVQQTARLLKLTAADVAEVLGVFQHCDPYLDRKEVTFSPLLLPCTQVWQRFGNNDADMLSNFANQLKDYYTS